MTGSRALCYGLTLPRRQPPLPLLSAHLRHLSVKEMPLSVFLERVLKDLGVTKLGQLHGFPIRHLRYWPQCGSRTHAELEALLRRAEAGEFSRSRRLSVAQAEAELLRRIDELISGLPEQARVFLALRFGGAGEAGQTYRQIGQAHGVTRSAVGRSISDAIARLIPNLRDAAGLALATRGRRCQSLAKDA